MTDAYQNDPSGKTAEDNSPVSSEMPDTGQQSLFAGLADRPVQPSGTEAPAAGKEVHLDLAAEKQDYLEKLKQEHQDYLARLEANRHEHEHSGEVSHEHSAETSEEIIEPRAVEIPDATPQQSLEAVPDVAPQQSVEAPHDPVPQEQVVETAAQPQQPVASESPDAGGQEFLSSVKLGAEQLDYLNKLEADHQARLAQLEADRQKALSDSAEGTTQSIGESSAPVPDESFAAAQAQDAPRQEYVPETSEQFAQPVNSETPDAFPQYSFAAAEAQEAPSQEHFAGSSEPFTQPVSSETPDTFPQYSFAEAQDALPQELFAAPSENLTHPVSTETPDAFPQYSFATAQDAPPQEPFAATPEPFAQPLSAPVQDPVQQDHIDSALGSEQLDYLSKLEAQHQEYLAKLEAAKQPHADAITEQPESIGMLPAAALPGDYAASGEPVVPIDILPPISTLSPDQPAAPASNAAVTIVVIGIVLGVLFGGLIAAMTWKATKPAATPAPASATPETGTSPASRDLESVDSSATGLSGHLTTKWDGKLAYTFVITPDDPSRQAAFASMVNDPPRPLSMTIELKNNYGFILCSREAVLKFDPAKAAAEQKTQGASSPSSASDEAAREKDKDVFQNQTGANGKLASIRAQGEIPCPAEAYANFAYWSFTPNFPDITEQDQLLQDRQDAAAAAAPKHAARKRTRTPRTH